MSKLRASWLLTLVLSWPGIAAGADSIQKGYTFLDAAAGQRVVIGGTFTDPGTRRITLTEVTTPDAETWAHEGVLSENKDSISFDLPVDFKPGRYRVRIELGGTPPIEAPGELRVLKPSETQVSVEAVKPKTPYRNPEHNNKYDIEIAGTNFSMTPENNIIEIGKVPIDIDRKCDGSYKTPCLKAEKGNETRKLTLEGFDPGSYPCPLMVRVRVGNGDNVSKEIPLTLSRLSEGGIKLWSVVVFGLLMLAVYWLVRKGIESDKINGKPYGPIYAFLMDKKTNTYSLSKFQLVLFTLVSVFGYIYIFLCRLFVQWNFELPPVPEGLPALLAVSAGTTVAAAGITVARGSAGAGPVHPSPADFISAGGLVLPERFQFFVWTLVSAFGMVATVLASDPTTITMLPKIPDGMLYLMGLSSAGYLGGKLVRGPGPMITSIDARKTIRLVDDVAHYDLAVTISGENLSPKATFQVDDKRIDAEKATLGAKVLQGQDLALCTTLEITLGDVPVAFFEGEHSLRIINNDGQAAEAKYGAVIESVNVSGTPPDKVFLITGRDFRDPSEAKWTPTTGDEVPIPAADVEKVSETELKIKVPETITGEGSLTIISPGKLTTTREKLSVT